ncbi:hypothetical protein WA026_005333 [Henosepilachna vigintioctopunctata]|uniref:Malic enzyme n=1 Tax=Henosepilachna vigintioctopunctata TaxID=420089 RepID=A0AAW1UNL7_9CUCU
MDHLKNPRLNKGLAFTLEERQALGIHGLQPAAQRTQDEQVANCKAVLESYNQPINKYVYLTELKDRNEKLFFKLVSENIEEMLPIVYTPTVGLACLKFGIMYRRPHGLFVTIHDKGHIYDILQNWHEPDIHAVVFTDGERILGLGDLGAYGMGIPIGKLALYTALAGFKPHHCLPICLDVGTDNKQLLEDRHYVGLRHTRVRGEIYDEFIDEFMTAIVKRYGQDTLIQFEDFGTANAARLLKRYRNKYCTFNDDIQGTAAVSLAGVLASNRITKKKVSDHKILFYGAGTAAIGIADLLTEFMVREGISREEARQRIYMMDINGIISTGRNDLFGHQTYYAKDHSPEKDLLKIINEIKPSFLIGASTQGGAFTPPILKAMASYNDRPLIFALSNPTIKTECTPQDAYEHTEGRCIYCSGSPFPDVIYNNKVYKPGQGNNSYIFPGVALGVVLAQVHHIPDEYFIIAAEVISENVLEDELAMGSLFPGLNHIRDCSVKIATRIMDYAYKNNVATLYPEPKDKIKFIKSNLYNYNYIPSLTGRWSWPDESNEKKETC